MLVFTLVNMSFRVLSYSYFVQYFDDWYIVPLLLSILLPNTYMFLCHSDLRDNARDYIATFSSICCSLVVPAATLENPHLHQKKITYTNDENKKEREEEKRKAMDKMKRSSTKLALITSPIILAADGLVVACVDSGTFQNDSIWTNRQLKCWFYQAIEHYSNIRLTRF